MRYDSGAERLRAQLADPNLLVVSLGVFDGMEISRLPEPSQTLM